MRFDQSARLLIYSAAFACIPLSARCDRLIEADARGTGEKTDRMYNFCVGAGRANEGLRADWQRQLRRAHAECGFRYIRFHGLFDDDMGVYQEDKHGQAIYNWQYIDELFDFLQSIGMKPFVELGFMPNALASGDHTIFWYRANVTPPKDYAKWEQFMAAFAHHVTERYGSEEVKTWYFEVWNEPNLSGFWYLGDQGKDPKKADAAQRNEYFKLYSATVRGIKSVDESYRVGGPATAGSGWVSEMLKYCSDDKAPIDFVSTHAYATTAGYLDETGNAGTVFSPDRNAITSEVKESRQKITSSSFPKAELHYTEWSASYTPFDPIHDSYHSAAFILDKIKHVGTAANSMSYWTFTDIFEESGPRTTPFHGGFGLLNYQDLPKPAYFAYKYLNELGDEKITSADDQSLVSKRDDGSVQVLFWDFTITHPGPSIINQEYYKIDHPSKPKGEVEVKLAHLAPGKYILKAHRVGYESNDVYSAWHKLGSPAQLTKKQVVTLRAAADDKPVREEDVKVPSSGIFNQKFEIRENDVWLVELVKS
ncbi:MAG TPA: hypothetical protein VIM69_03240 [Opitutaceae bacterium]